MTPDQEWHWGEGNKFAMEAMKALLWSARSLQCDHSAF
jgi:hypothetical protein